MTSHVNIDFCQNGPLGNIAIMSLFLSVSCWNRNDFFTMIYCLLTDGVVGKMRILIHSGFAVVN